MGVYPMINRRSMSEWKLAQNDMSSKYYEDRQHYPSERNLWTGKYEPHSAQCEGCGAWGRGGSSKCSYCGRPKSQ